MAITLFAADSAAISTTEYSMVSDATFVPVDTGSASDGVYQLFLDVSDMIVSDELQIRVYEKVRAADTQRIVYQQILFGTQLHDFVMPGLILMHNWDMTLDAIAGTITVAWAIKKVA
jgi:hypothetical protein